MTCAIYIRESTREQADGFSPDMQEKALRKYARDHRMTLAEEHVYIDYKSGRTDQRERFQDLLATAERHEFDVVLIYHTSRFARNIADSRRHKNHLRRKLGIKVVSVTQFYDPDTPSGRLTEGVFELFDENYSDQLSFWIGQGLRERFEQGQANGIPPLGYKNQPLDGGKRVIMVPAPETLPALLEILRLYCTGQYSYRTLADRINSLGYRNRYGRCFAKGSIETVIQNRFYVGEITWHHGEPDQEIKKGIHEVIPEVAQLWRRCEGLRVERRFAAGKPSAQERYYPLSGVLVCDMCGKPYHGEASLKRSGKVYRQMHHFDHCCPARPRVLQADCLEKRFAQEVFGDFCLDSAWKEAILSYLARGQVASIEEGRLARIEKAIENLRKQHKWGDISDQAYREEKRQLDWQKAEIVRRLRPQGLDLERAAHFLNNFYGLWAHPHTSDAKRKEFVREAFLELRLRGRDIVGVVPRPQYVPLFARSIYVNRGGRSRGERI